MQSEIANGASFARFCAIAEKIEADPDLLSIPLANINRWLAQGQSAPHRLEQWRGTINAARASSDGMVALLALLRDDGEEARRLKSFSPFPGILTTPERDRLSCGYSH